MEAKPERFVVPEQVPRSLFRELGRDLDVDVSFQRSRDGAAVARFSGDPLERGVVDLGHTSAYVELHARDGKAGTRLLDRAVRRGLDAGRRRTVLLERAAQRHAVARCLGGGEKLFRVRARAFFEPRAEVVLPGKAVCAAVAPLSALETTLPLRARAACRHLLFLRS